MNNTATPTKPFLLSWPVRISVAIIAATAILKWQSTQMPENTYVPPYQVPAANAKDYFMQATTLSTDSIHWIAPTSYRPVRPTSNTMVTTGYKDLTLAQKDDIISKNKFAFAEIEAGLDYPYVDPVPRTFTSSFAHIAKFRMLARGLRAASEDRAAHKDWGGAAEYDLDTMQMGSDLTHGSIIVEALTGFACESIGRQDFDPVISHLTLQQSRVALARLETIINNNASASSITIKEKQFTQGALLSSFRDGDWKNGLDSLADTDPRETSNYWHSPEEMLQEIEIRLESPKTAYNCYTRYMDKLATVADEPWPQFVQSTQLKLPTDPINRILLPAFNGNFDVDTCRTEDDLLLFSIALNAYKLEHGSYPTTLNGLTPAYLTTVPSDPFTDGKPFKYRVRSNTYLLYSVGPDDTDDGGKPVLVDSTPGYDPDGHMLEKNAKGDLVAGVTNY